MGIFHKFHANDPIKERVEGEKITDAGFGEYNLF